MEVSCEFSFYPLGVAHLSAGIDAALAVLKQHGLTVESGPMSSRVSGPVESVSTAGSSSSQPSPTPAPPSMGGRMIVCVAVTDQGLVARCR